MKPLIPLLVLLLIGCGSRKKDPEIPSGTHPPKATITGKSLRITTSTGVRVVLQEVAGGLLRVRVVRPGRQFRTLPFFITRQETGTDPRKTDRGYGIGSYLVVPERDGYTLWRGRKKLYHSLFYVKDKYLVEKKLCLDKELLYGMGEVANRLALVNRSMVIYNVSRYGNQAMLYVPFYFSSGGDGFYYNAHGKDVFSFGMLSKAQVRYKTKHDSFDYFYTWRSSPKELVSWFYLFSRSRSLLPRWAYGYLQSKYGYRNQQEVVELVKKFEQHRIPISAVILDLHWFKHMGDFGWDQGNWPDPAALDRFLEERNIKLVTITEPFFSEKSKHYPEFEKRGLFAKDKEGKTVTWKSWWLLGKGKYGAVINPLAPGAEEALGKLYVDMHRSGIDGFWTDLGEPEKVPARARFNEYSELEFHNYFNREWSRIIYNAMRKAFPDYRLFNLTRSGFTGSARYNVSIWSGDVAANFFGLRKQPILGINAGLTGFSYWGSDAGGYASGKKLPGRELFIRWMQFAAFSPVFRAHGSRTGREPWIHGKAAMEIIRRYIRLRYRLLPYIYATAYQTYLSGIPMMRPLMLEHPEDGEVARLKDQYYFGDFLLVVPILYRIARVPQVRFYLPQGDWYDLHTLRHYQGGWHSVPSAIEDIPVFLKSGAIVPLDTNRGSGVLLVPGKKPSHFLWYDDDGESNGYEKGNNESIAVVLNAREVVFGNVRKERTLTLYLPTNLVQLKELTPEGKNELFYLARVTLKPGVNRITF